MGDDLSKHKLPCDVTVNHMTFRKGVSLKTFVDAATRWHAIAAQAQRERLGVEGNSLREVLAALQHKDAPNG